jgi:hypothetical protein
MTAADTIARGIGARIARDFVRGSSIGAILRQVERAQRRRNWVDALELAEMAGIGLQLLLLMINAVARVGELAWLADQRIEARAQRHRRPPRHELHPVRTRRCSRAPNDASSLPLCPEVAA